MKESNHRCPHMIDNHSLGEVEEHHWDDKYDIINIYLHQ